MPHGIQEMPLEPVAVTHPTRLADFVVWLLQHHSPPTTLVICSDEHTFIAQLRASIQDQGEPADMSHEASAATTGEIDAEAQDPEPHPLLSRTLRVLGSSRTVQCAYCPSVAALRAYLSTLPKRSTTDFEHGHRSGRRAGVRVLALVNVLMLHRQSSSYSAQGLSVALAAAVEAASRSQAQLVVFESVAEAEVVCSEPIGVADNDSHGERPGAGEAVRAEIDEDESRTARQVETDGATPAEGGGESRGAGPYPWDHEIPMVNAATKTFGVSDQRDLMTRKIKAKNVIQRWCRFRALRDM